MLAESRVLNGREAYFEPLLLCLRGMFGLSIGMMLNLTASAERPLFVVSMAAALIATKAAIIFGLGLAFRLGWRQALAFGLLLSQGGEFGFVLLAQAQGASLIAPDAASLYGAGVTQSMANTTVLMMVVATVCTAHAHRGRG